MTDHALVDFVQADRERLQGLALASGAWPFAEARSILARLGGKAPAKGYVLFETGYGPSGLPHIGTFGEVARTTMVRHAFSLLSDIPTHLLAFSDDMDGLRKVPDNVPNPEMLKQHLGKPLTSIPDPFGTHESFGHHNNARLRAFLNRFGFKYEFASATDYYTSGRFDTALLLVLAHHDKIRDIILPTLGAERAATYSPILPVCPRTGRVLQVRVLATNPRAGTLVYEDEDGQHVETPVTGGRCKLQWKADWAMRWTALGVDYEMAGKDLIDSVTLSTTICKAIGGTPPINFIYELFLDENGEKISKSRGNGLTMDEWLAYAPEDSLSLFMFQKPKAAKRLHFGIIPKTVDEYFTFLEKYSGQDEEHRLDNPVWHIHRGRPPADLPAVSFGLLLNLAGVCHAEDKAAPWRFVSAYAPGVTPETSPILDALIGHTVRYYKELVKPHQRYRPATAEERLALTDLADALAALPAGADAEALQTLAFETGKRHACFPDLKSWFRALYQILLGQDEGPRMGSFFAIYGIEESVQLLRRAAAGEALG